MINLKISDIGTLMSSTLTKCNLSYGNMKIEDNRHDAIENLEKIRDLSFLAEKMIKSQYVSTISINDESLDVKSILKTV